LVGCDGGGGEGLDGGGRPPSLPGPGCNSVRLTSYAASPSGGWCEFPSDLPMLPAFVRDERLTAAVAEPFNGGFLEGEPGEACGECWEVDTVSGTRVVMIDNLCPNEGNPLCQGAHFHLDLSLEAAAALNGGGLDEASARRVACPVEGGVHVLINDENFSYLRLQFVNLRIPVRSATVRASAPGSAALPLRRSGGAWEAAGDEPLDAGGEGVVFSITSAQGQTLESDVIVPAHPDRGSTFDLGVQFDDQEPATGGACVFTPPRDIFDDDFGGIDGVRWQINPWGEAEAGFFGRVEDGCFDGACLRVMTLAQWSGFHLFYRQSFPTSTFSRVSLRVHASSPGEISIAGANDGERCEALTVPVGPEWATVSYDVSTSCAAMSEINGITIDNPGADIALTLDDVRFED